MEGLEFTSRSVLSNTKALEEQLLERIGQCVLTAPTTAVFNGLPEAEKQFNMGFKLKFFGDGMESETQIAGRKDI